MDFKLNLTNDEGVLLNQWIFAVAMKYDDSYDEKDGFYLLSEIKNVSGWDIDKQIMREIKVYLISEGIDFNAIR